MKLKKTFSISKKSPNNNHGHDGSDDISTNASSSATSTTGGGGSRSNKKHPHNLLKLGFHKSKVPSLSSSLLTDGAAPGSAGSKSAGNNGVASGTDIPDDDHEFMYGRGKQHSSNSTTQSKSMSDRKIALPSLGGGSSKGKSKGDRVGGNTGSSSSSNKRNKRNGSGNNSKEDVSFSPYQALETPQGSMESSVSIAGTVGSAGDIYRVNTDDSDHDGGNIDFSYSAHEALDLKDTIDEKGESDDDEVDDGISKNDDNSNDSLGEDMKGDASPSEIGSQSGDEKTSSSESDNEDGDELQKPWIGKGTANGITIPDDDSSNIPMSPGNDDSTSSQFQTPIQSPLEVDNDSEGYNDGNDGNSVIFSPITPATPLHSNVSESIAESLEGHDISHETQPQPQSEFQSQKPHIQQPQSESEEQQKDLAVYSTEINSNTDEKKSRNSMNGSDHREKPGHVPKTSDESFLSGLVLPSSYEEDGIALIASSASDADADESASNVDVARASAITSALNGCGESGSGKSNGTDPASHERDNVIGGGPSNMKTKNFDNANTRRGFGPIDLDDFHPSSPNNDSDIEGNNNDNNRGLKDTSIHRGSGPVDLDDSLPSSLASSPAASRAESPSNGNTNTKPYFDQNGVWSNARNVEYLQLDTIHGSVTGMNGSAIAGSPNEFAGKNKLTPYSNRTVDDDADEDEIDDETRNSNLNCPEKNGVHEEEEPEVTEENQADEHDTQFATVGQNDSKIQQSVESNRNSPVLYDQDIINEISRRNDNAATSGDDSTNDNNREDDEEMSTHSWDLLRRTDSPIDSVALTAIASTEHDGYDDGESESIMAMSTVEEVAGKKLIQSLLGNGPANPRIDPLGARVEDDENEFDGDHTNQADVGEDSTHHTNYSRDGQLCDDDYYKQDYTMMFRSASNRTRSNTASSQLSDDDYYKQDYLMFRKISHQSSSSVQTDDRFEMSARAQSTLFPQKENSLRFSSEAVRGLTEPDMPERMSSGKVAEDEEGGDYGDFYTDAELPLVHDGDLHEEHQQIDNRASSGDLTAYPSSDIRKTLSSGELRELTEPDHPKMNIIQPEDDDGDDEGDYSKFYTEDEMPSGDESDANARNSNIVSTPSTIPMLPDDGEFQGSFDSTEKKEHVETLPYETPVRNQMPPIQPIEAPISSHKDITDNLVAVGMMSLFVGDGNIGGSLKKQNAVSMENSGVQPSPGAYSIPSLGSPSPVLPSRPGDDKEAAEEVKPTKLRFDGVVSESPQEIVTYEADDAGTPLAVDSTSNMDSILCEKPTPRTSGNTSAVVPTPVEHVDSSLCESSSGIHKSTEGNEQHDSMTKKAIGSADTPERNWAPFPASSPSYVSSMKRRKKSRRPKPLDEIEVRENISSDDDFEDGDVVPELMYQRSNASDSFLDSPSKCMEESYAISLNDSQINLNDPDAAEKLFRDNKKLRAKRKELLASLSSMALKFAASEKKTAAKVSALEKKISTMESTHSIPTESETEPSTEPTKASWVNKYDIETVRRLSSGVLKQEQKLEEKEKVISQLKLRCQGLKRNLADKDEEYEQEKQLWKEERQTLERKLSDQSAYTPERQNVMMFKKELLSSRMDYNRLKKDLENALDDVTSLTTALENNNKMNESILRELEELRSWKTNHLKCHPELEITSKDHQESERRNMPTEAAKPQAKGVAEDTIIDPPTLSRATSLETAVNNQNQAPISGDSLPAVDSAITSNEDEQSQVTKLEIKLREKNDALQTLQKDFDSTTKMVSSLKSDLESSRKEIEQLRESMSSERRSPSDATSDSNCFEQDCSVIKSMADTDGDVSVHKSFVLEANQNVIDKLDADLAASRREILQLKKRLESSQSFDLMSTIPTEDNAEVNETSETTSPINYIDAKTESITGLEPSDIDNDGPSIGETRVIDADKPHIEKTADSDDSNSTVVQSFQSSEGANTDIVKSLQEKIAYLEKKIAKYEKTAEENEEATKANEDVKSPEASVTSPSKDSISSANIEPLSPRGDGMRIIAANRFLNLRRGWNSISGPKPTYTYDPANPPSQQEVEAMLKERDSKAASLEVTIQTYTNAMDQMRADIEKIKADKATSEKQFSEQIRILTEENETLALQVVGFEKAFMALNEERNQVETLESSEHAEESESEAENDEEPVDDASSTAMEEEGIDFKAKNAELQTKLDELESNRSNQEEQIETLRAELIKLRVSFEQEKDATIEELKSENELIKTQREALENQLIEINKSAGVLRQNLATQSSSPRKPPASPGTENEEQVEDPVSRDDGAVGSDPVLVAQVCMLENANAVLEKTVNSLRSEMQEKLAPLREKIAQLEQEKRIFEEEMQTKLECREMTIANLETSLKQATSSRLNATKKKRKPKKMSQQQPTSSDPGLQNPESAHEQSATVDSS